MDNLSDFKIRMVGMPKKELQSLNMMVVDAIRKASDQERKDWISNFKVGETVSFVTQNRLFKGETIVGKLLSISTKVAQVQSDAKHGLWCVTPMKLQKAS